MGLKFTFAQLVVQTGQTPQFLVNNVLIGNNVQAFNITFSGNACQIGSFDATNTTLASYGMTQGIILATGCIDVAQGPNTVPNATSPMGGLWGPGDPDLEALIGGTAPINDAAVLEFDFVPLGDTVKFEYIFASEEYEDFVGTNFNDVFGFFLSGPGITGPYSNNAINIALVPGTTTPVAINNVNYCVNSQYYVSNLCCPTNPCCTGVCTPLTQCNSPSFPPCSTNPQYIQFDGHTVKLTAIYPVVCGDTYHIKIAIGDALDASFDSGVFLRKESFQSNVVHAQIVASAADSVSIIEGCGPATLLVERSDSMGTSVIYLDEWGVPVAGVDYTSLPDSIVLPNGTLDTSFTIVAFQDGMNEGPETLWVVIKQFICQQWINDTSMLIIRDSSNLTLSTMPADTITGCPCQPVQVTASPQGGIPPYTIIWDDGNTTTTGNTLTLSGCSNALITVQVTDSCGYTATDTFSLVISSSSPISAQLPDTVSTQCGSGSSQVVIHVTSVTGGSPPYVYQWSNGSTTDSTVVITNTPVWVYVSIGDACNPVQYVDSVFVQVGGSPPVAAFSAPSVCEGEAVQFTNSSSGATSYQWFFGDGTSSSVVSPSHTYASSGIYFVTLVASGSSGCTDTSVASVTINPAPQVSFSVNNACYGVPVQFSNSSTGASSYVWDFGDGITSSVQNPTHSYSAPGTYTVTLIGGSPSGCMDTFAMPVTVFPLPQASFTAGSQCEKQTVQFTNTSTGATSYQWFFGDGTSATGQAATHAYATSGTYNVTLIAQSGTGCADTFSAPVQINPIPQVVFTSSGACDGDSVQFYNQSSISSGSIAAWLWDFGDGNTSSAQSPSHLYPSYGQYTVVLVATSDSGCISADTQVVAVYPLPVASFAGEDKCINAPPVSFTNSSSIPYGSITQVTWYFGDGTSSTVWEPQHTYQDTGSYQVTLVALSSQGCTDTATGTVNVLPSPQANYYSPDPEKCPPACFVLVNTSIPGGTSSLVEATWTMGTQVASGLDSVILCEDDPGAYSPVLVVKNSLGCYDTFAISDYIIVYDRPDAFFVVDSLVVTNTTGAIHVYDASVGATSFTFILDSDSVVVEPAFTWYFAAQDTGIHQIMEVVENIYGCRDTFMQEVYVKPVPSIYVPNAFSPDGDGVNDEFMWRGFGIMEDRFYSFSIYDRWGTLVWSTTEHKGWDGTHRKGDPAPEGVYIWVLRYRDIEGRVHKIMGSVTLLR